MKAVRPLQVEFLAGGQPQSAGLHGCQEIMVRGLEARHRAHGVVHQHDALGMGKVRDQMLDRGAHAVAARLARDHQQSGTVQPLQQTGVQQGRRIGSVRHLGLQGAVMLGPGIEPLENVAYGALALLLPVATGGQHIGMDTVAPAAHFAVHGPDHQRVAAARFECIQIVQAALQGLGVARPEHARPHLCRRDRGERCHIAAIALLPEGRVGDVVALVRVQRHRDGIHLRCLAPNPSAQPLHVGMGASHGQAGALAAGAPVVRQIAEIVLGVYEQEVEGGRWHEWLLASKRFGACRESRLQCSAATVQAVTLCPVWSGLRWRKQRGATLSRKGMVQQGLAASST